jgi:peptide deformylase
MKILQITEFGDTVLRQNAKQLTQSAIASQKIQQLIKNMRYTLTEQKLGVGLAAPQVGEPLAISVISVRPTAHRTEVDPLELVIINPKITKTFGYRTQFWEGCISAGKSGLFAKTPRYKKVEVTYLDENGRKKKDIFEGLPAQIMQHEVDHLDGILFMDHVKDATSYMTMKEYKKMIKTTKENNE